MDLRPNVVYKAREILNKTLNDYKERGLLVCEEDGEQLIDRTIVGTGRLIHYPKDWHTCSKGKPIANIHTHTNLQAFSIQDLAYIGSAFKEFGKFAVCIAYPVKEIGILKCIINEDDKEEVIKQYNLQKKEDEKERMKKPIFPTEINYLDRLNLREITIPLGKLGDDKYG